MAASTGTVTLAREAQGTRVPGWLAWLAALLAAALILVVSNCQSLDPDSRLHILLASHLAKLPLDRWIAPEWWGWTGWQGPEGLYREHPIGILLLPTILAKLGYPVAQAGFLVNAFYQVLTLVLFQRLASVFASPLESRALTWQIQLIPLAFTFRVRANHEQAVLLFLLAALWGAERSRTNARWIALTVFAVVATLLVKGIFTFPTLLWCAVWLWTVRRPEGAPGRDTAAWMGVGIAGVMALAVAAGYENLYRHVTGVSFIGYYLPSQLGRAAIPQSTWRVFHKAYNFVWYGARVLWFGFPASVAAAVAAWSCRRDLVRALAHKPVAESDPAKSRARGGLVFVSVVTLLYLCLFCISDRDSIRYIFPACYLFAACGCVVATRAWAPLRSWSERFDRYHPVGPAVVWLAAFVLSVVAHKLHVPRIKFWSPPGSY